MKLYVWRPKGYGYYSYFVMAASEEDALALVAAHIEREHDYATNDGFPGGYEEVEIYEPGQVAVNLND